MPIELVMQQLVLTNIPMDLSNFVIYIYYTACQKKVNIALYMLNFVLFASLYSSQGKGLRKKSLNEKTNYLFLISLKTFYFFRTSWETNYFSKKSQPPPEYQMVRP